MHLCLFTKANDQNKIQLVFVNNSNIEASFCCILFSDYTFRVFNSKPIFLHDLNVFTNMTIDFSLHFIDSYLVFLTLILSIDRLMALKNPTEVKNLVTYLYSKYLVGITLVGTFIIKIPSLILCYENCNRKFNIVFCTLVSPILFNIFPTIVILVVNAVLVFELINYHRVRKTSESVLEFRRRSTVANIAVFKRSAIAQLVAFSNNKPVIFSNKMCYIMIALVTWQTLTTLPYYILNIFHLQFQLYSIKNLNYRNVVNTIQVISSIFFNSNHCINFFIYYFFNFEFRKCVLKFLK